MEGQKEMGIGLEGSQIRLEQNWMGTGEMSGSRARGDSGGGLVGNWVRD